MAWLGGFGRAQALTAVLLAATVTAAALGACSASSTGLHCGEGTQQQGSSCVAAPADAAADAGADATLDAPGDSPHDAPRRDATDAEVVDASDAGPIAFAGVSAVAPASSTSLLGVWAAATPLGSASSDAGAFTYRVYVGPASAPLSYATPALTTTADFAVLAGLTSGQKYRVGVRPVNAAGIEDANDVALTGTPQNDTSPPAFTGVATATAAGNGAVSLTWAAAQDNLSPAGAITYLVFVAATSGGQDFTQPALVTPPGATSATVTGLEGTAPLFFVVRARDAAGNTDQNHVQVSAAPGADTAPPVFAGCSSASLVSGGQIAVDWLPATDAVTPQAYLQYEVFQSTTSGQFDFTMPVVTVPSQPGVVTNVTLPETQANTRYYFVCRAKDQAGNVDGNTVQVSAVTSADPVPPTFGGITSFVPDPATFSVTLSWSAATDGDSSPPSKIVYDVYEATVSMGEAFSAPPAASSTPGATTITLTNLPGNTLLFFVVRARDMYGNHDDNTVEYSFQTNVSFAQNVQALFTQDCAVVGCHVPGNPTGGLILAQGFAYGQIVGQPAGEGPTVDGGAPDGGPLRMPYVDPSNPDLSFLNIKINSALLAALKVQYGKSFGTVMPAPQTGSVLSSSDLATIGDWISQGALNN